MEQREYYMNIRKTLLENYKKKSSHAIVQKCAAIIHEKTPKTIALFCATPDEPNIISLLSSFPDIQFCVPKVISDTAMKMFHITSLEDVEKGKFGILEPKLHCREIAPKTIDMIFVPTVTIDKQGNRIGMGKGYYDRYLAQCSNVFKIGVVFAEQISKQEFMSKSWDVRMDAIIY